MISRVLYHKSTLPCTSNHSLSSLIKMNVVVTVNSFVTSILAAVSEPSVSLKDTLHGLVFSQMVSSVGCAANGSLTINDIP